MSLLLTVAPIGIAFVACVAGTLVFARAVDRASREVAPPSEWVSPVAKHYGSFFAASQTPP